VKTQNLKIKTISKKEKKAAGNGETMPADLLAAENVLSELAGVFFSASPAGAQVSDLFPQEVKKLPDVTDIYRVLVEQIPAVVFIAFFDKSFGEAYVSPQIEATLGYTQEEWLRDPVRWYQQIHPEDKDRWSVEAAQMFSTGEPLRSVYRVLARDGSVIWFHCEVKMIRHPDGRPWFIHGIGFDISELKHTEEALIKSEDMLRSIFESAPDTMIVVDDKGKIRRVNAQVEAVFGYKAEELIDKPVEILIPEHFGDKNAELRADLAAIPHLRLMGTEFNLYGKRKDGSEFPVEVTFNPVDDQSNSFVIGVIRNITRRQHNEEALREYAERMEILSRRLMEAQEAERRIIALELHDQIGQILTGLKLKLEMLARSTPVESHDRLDEAQTLVNELIGRTRELSLNLRPATLDHLGLLSALLRHFQYYTSQTNVRIDFQHTGLEAKRFTPELETTVFRIVQEALTNVARHSGAKEAIVRIWSDEETLAVQIEDQGKGFDVTPVMIAGQSSGLTGMRERALLAGGQFTVESDSAGTRLRGEWNLATLHG